VEVQGSTMEHKSIKEIRDEIEKQIARMREPLFTSKGAPDPDWYLNAWLQGGWDTYAEGYKRVCSQQKRYGLTSGINRYFRTFCP
jgi:hypothetical protein